jgi:hypothetical protein
MMRTEKGWGMGMRNKNGMACRVGEEDDENQLFFVSGKKS